jgi:RNA polymerase sigma-70 factor (ECF subfamily)
MDATEAAAVLARAREGDCDAFRALVERHSHGAFRLAFRLTGNEQDAEDVVQESFLKAYRQIGRFESRSNFGTWLHRIIVNCSIDLLRERQARRERAQVEDGEQVMHGLPAEQPGPERVARGGEIRRRLDASLASLSPRERAAFVLRHYEGRSIEEIGGALGVRTSAAKHSVFRAVKKLREALAPLRSES